MLTQARGSLSFGPDHSPVSEAHIKEEELSANHLTYKVAQSGGEELGLEPTELAAPYVIGLVSSGFCNKSATDWVA